MKHLQVELSHKTKAIEDLMSMGVMDTVSGGGENVSEIKTALKRAKLDKEELALKVRRRARLACSTVRPPPRILAATTFFCCYQLVAGAGYLQG
jgi:hypothetical protein